jgi:hypothetical protein
MSDDTLQRCTDAARAALRALLAGGDIVDTAMTLAALHHEAPQVVDATWVHLASELDDVPPSHARARWEPTYLAALLARTERHRRLVRLVALRNLCALEPAPPGAGAAAPS